MQFGQLLTHLDTTQQMINNTLKDNNTLLAQVGSQRRAGNASGSTARWHHSDMITGGFWEGSVSLKQRKLDLITPSHLPHRCEPSAPISLLFSHISFFSPHQVQQTMKENLHAIEENFSALDERMKKVSKWTEGRVWLHPEGWRTWTKCREQQRDAFALNPWSPFLCCSLFCICLFFSPSGRLFRRSETIKKRTKSDQIFLSTLLSLRQTAPKRTAPLMTVTLSDF